MTGMPRETGALDAVDSLVDSLLHEFDVVELLTDLTNRCADLLDVASAGLLLADPQGQLHLMAATSEGTRALELFRLLADEGPCLDCYSIGQPVSASDLLTERQRWPQFAVAATDIGFASVHAVPMRAAGTVLGALGLFGTDVGALNEPDLLTAQTLAHIASVAILQERPRNPASVAARLKFALTSRTVIEQAKGYLSESLDMSVDDAFVLLRGYARDSEQHLTEVARGLLSDPWVREFILVALNNITASRS